MTTKPAEQMAQEFRALMDAMAKNELITLSDLEIEYLKNAVAWEHLIDLGLVRVDALRYAPTEMGKALAAFISTHVVLRTIRQDVSTPDALKTADEEIEVLHRDWQNAIWQAPVDGFRDVTLWKREAKQPKAENDTPKP